jgi:putative hydrolase of the HAD superfamily
MAIKAVVFDIGGVLERVDDDAWPETWIGRWETKMNLPAGHFASSVAEHEPPGELVLGEVSEAQMREMYARALGLDDDQADEMMRELWDAYCGELDVELRDFAASLRPAYTTAILSNSADGARREEQRRYGFEDLVDVIIYSHEVGLAKPDPAVYRLTERRVGAQPHEIVFLDDRDFAVEAARTLGWNAILHKDTAESIRAIRALLEETSGG